MGCTFLSAAHFCFFSVLQSAILPHKLQHFRHAARSVHSAFRQGVRRQRVAHCYLKFFFKKYALRKSATWSRVISLI